MSACYRPSGVCPRKSAALRTVRIVTVSQNGRILHQTRSVTGAFELPDLSQNISGNRCQRPGKDGSVRPQVNTASVPFMARARTGSLWAAGRPLYLAETYNNSTVSPDFLLGRPQFGSI